jgi:hypothetical protein
MSLLTSAIRGQVMDRVDAVLGVARPAPPTVGGALMSRLAAASALRLALRWPALSVLLIVSVVAARLMTRRPRDIIAGPAPKVSAAGDQPGSL